MNQAMEKEQWGINESGYGEYRMQPDTARVPNA